MLTHKTQDRNEDVPSPWMFQAGACARFLGSWPVIVGRRSKIFQAALIIDKSDDPSSCFEKSLRLPTATAFGSLGCADFRSLEAWSCDECPGALPVPKKCGVVTEKDHPSPRADPQFKGWRMMDTLW